MLVVVLLTSSIITGCVRLFGDPAGLHCRQGNELYSQGRLDEAIDEYTEAIRIDPRRNVPYCNRGFAYTEQGRKAEAIADFEKFISLADNPEQWLVIEMAKQQIEELSR